NVWEYCWDKYSATSSNRVYHGGGRYDSASRCGVSLRSNGDPNYRYSNIGFRVVRKAD
ncbi:MAG: SUMF1/EgtB/PvdO family nonheme iron enzyme, partial [Treponema sp.]|nr:SUMF1/EgtB/PvdO family nonheme iron enzyme [Treponema sp.]